MTVAQVGPEDLVVQSTVEKKALIGASRKEESLQPLGVRGVVTALALDGRGDDLFVGTSAGQVLHFDMRDKGSPKEMEAVQATAGPGVPVTALGFLIGDRTLVVGDRAGAVSTWQVVPPPSGGERRLTRVHEFTPHADPVVSDQCVPAGQGVCHRRHLGHRARPLRHVGEDAPVDACRARRPAVSGRCAQGRRHSGGGRAGTPGPVARRQSRTRR